MVIEDEDTANALAGNDPPNKLKEEEPLAKAHDLFKDSKYMQGPEAGVNHGKIDIDHSNDNDWVALPLPRVDEERLGHGSKK